MHPIDSDLIASMRRRQLMADAANHRSHRRADRRTPIRVRLGRFLIAVGHRLERPRRRTVAIAGC